MLKLSSKLMLLSLLSAFAVISMGSARAEEEHEKEHHAKNRSEPGNVTAKMTVKTGVITVTNRGYGPLEITADPVVTRVSGSGSFAIVTPSTGTPCAKTVMVPAKGGTCTIAVQYTPLDTEISTARVTLTDSGAETATQDTMISVN